MRSFKFLIGISVSVALVVLSGTRVMTKKTGAPLDTGGIGYTGGFREAGRTCATASCHPGNAQQRDGMIESNVSGEGYHSGSTYEITVTISQPPRIRYGFMASPQGLDGSARGGVSATNGSSKVLIGGNNYIGMTHTEAGTNGPSQSKAWTFNWTAPAQIGLGDVYFFVACNAANNNNMASGDQIFRDTVIIPEALTNGIADPKSAHPQVELAPNPTFGPMTLTFSGPRPGSVEYGIFDHQGRLIRAFQEHQLDPSGSHVLDVSDLAAGTYLMTLRDNDDIRLLRFVRY